MARPGGPLAGAPLTGAGAIPRRARPCPGGEGAATRRARAPAGRAPRPPVALATTLLPCAPMPAPAIDVLLPVHDALATLPAAVDDILAQEDVDLRLIAVLDTHGTGRDDGSGAWLTRRARGDPRLVVLPSAGSGLTDALQTGLDAAEAPLLSLMESDDRCPPRRLVTLRDALIASEACGAPGGRPLDGVVSRVEPFGAVTEGMARYVAWQNGLVSHAAMAAERFVEIPALHQTGLYRTEVLRALGGYPTRGPWPADIDLWFRWFEQDRPVAKVPQALYRWRQHGRQSTRNSPLHTRAALRACRVDALARLHGRQGREPRPLRLLGAGRGLRRWERALREGPFELVDVASWEPGDPAPTLPDDGSLTLALYGLPAPRAALRAALDHPSEPDELLFTG